jgi:diacylglycerol kinase family enzyme
MDRRCLLIYNPFSGNNSITDAELLEMAEVRMPNFTVELWETTGEKDEAKISEKCEEFNPDLVLIGGGDGTVKLVAKSLRSKHLPMCILPLGSANGLAKCMGINDLVDTWEAVRDFKVRAIDAIQINGELCLHLADFGINANLIQKFEKEETRGMLGYVKNSLSEIFGTETTEFHLQIGGELIELKAKMIVIANGDRYGTGAIVNPRGLMNDGKFEIIALNPEHAEDYLRMTMAFIKGDIDQVHGVRIWCVEECQISNPQHAVFQIDGEMIGTPEFISATMEKHAFQFLTGKSYDVSHTSSD